MTRMSFEQVLSKKVTIVYVYKKMSAQDGEQLPTQPEDLANFMDQIFSQMESKFTDMAQQVLNRIEEMSSKINELESSIDTLMSQAEADK